MSKDSSLYWHFTFTILTERLQVLPRKRSPSQMKHQMSEKRNGKLFFQRREKCGRIQTQLAEIWGREAFRRNENPVETQWWSQGHRCKIKCEKVYFNKSPLADKNQTHKTGICFTRVTTALQCPAGVEKPSETLRSEGSITDPLQGHWLSRCSFRKDPPIPTSTEKPGRWEFQSSRRRCKNIQLSL